MNQVKVSAPDGSRFKANVIADPNEASRIPIRRQEPSARISFQGCFVAVRSASARVMTANHKWRFAISDDHGADIAQQTEKKGWNL